MAAGTLAADGIPSTMWALARAGTTALGDISNTVTSTVEASSISLLLCGAQRTGGTFSRRIRGPRQPEGAFRPIEDKVFSNVPGVSIYGLDGVPCVRTTLDQGDHVPDSTFSNAPRRGRNGRDRNHYTIGTIREVPGGGR